MIFLAVKSDFQSNRNETYTITPLDLGEVGVDSLILNPEFERKNRHGDIVDFYKKQLELDEVQKKTSVEITSAPVSDHIGTLNVHMFRPINLAHSYDEAMGAPIQLMDKFNVSILALQEVPLQYLDQFEDIIDSNHMFSTISKKDEVFENSDEPVTNVVISRYPIVEEARRFLPNDGPYTHRHRHVIYFRVPTHPYYGDKLFATTHLEVAEQSDDVTATRIRKQQIHDILRNAPLKAGPDIIMGDLNFKSLVDRNADKPTPEFALLDSKYHNEVALSEFHYTTPWNTTVDYIWYKKTDPKKTWGISSYSVNYPWSDHRPVIGVHHE